MTQLELLIQKNESLSPKEQTEILGGFIPTCSNGQIEGEGDDNGFQCKCTNKDQCLCNQGE